MGSDIHAFYEIPTSNGWKLLIEPIPESYWYEQILEEQDEQLTTLLIAGKNITQRDEAREIVEAMYEKMPLTEATERFGGKITQWDFGTPYEAESRDYKLFGKLAGVRYEGLQIWDLRDVPNDCDTRIRKQYEYYGVDAHSASWLTIEELLAEPKVNFDDGPLRYKHAQIEWIKENVPKNGRMIFWFDN